jgi:hypothetical protein
MVRNSVHCPEGRYHWSNHLCSGRVFSFKLGTRIVIGEVNILCFVD